MATVIANEKLVAIVHDGDAVEGLPPLGAPQEEKRFWFQRSKSTYDPQAIATQVCLAHPTYRLSRGTSQTSVTDFDLPAERV
jgi:hypothetical protein